MQPDPSTTCAKTAAILNCWLRRADQQHAHPAEVDTAWSAEVDQAIAYTGTEVDAELARHAHVSDMTTVWHAQSHKSTRCTITQFDDILAWKETLQPPTRKLR